MSKDIIYREDAIEAVEELNAISFYELNEHSKEAFTEIRRVLKAIPSADRPQGWIPCSERLPNENEWVLCSCNNGFAILILKLKGKVWHKTEAVEYLPKFVNAWMPLPTPWKGADDETE